MGSLTSLPNISPAPQVIYLSSAPPSSVGTPSAPTTPTPSTPTTPTNNVDEELRARAGSLLLRDRGRFGTVLTGFRGLLTSAENTGPRKALLGE